MFLGPNSIRQPGVAPIDFGSIVRAKERKGAAYNRAFKTINDSLEKAREKREKKEQQEASKKALKQLSQKPEFKRIFGDMDVEEVGKYIDPKEVMRIASDVAASDRSERITTANIRQSMEAGQRAQIHADIAKGRAGREEDKFNREKAAYEEGLKNEKIANDVMSAGAYLGRPMTAQELGKMLREAEFTGNPAAVAKQAMDAGYLSKGEFDTIPYDGWNILVQGNDVINARVDESQKPGENQKLFKDLVSFKTDSGWDKKDAEAWADQIVSAKVTPINRVTGEYMVPSGAQEQDGQAPAPVLSPAAQRYLSIPEVQNYLDKNLRNEDGSLNTETVSKLKNVILANYEESDWNAIKADLDGKSVEPKAVRALIGDFGKKPDSGGFWNNRVNDLKTGAIATGTKYAMDRGRELGGKLYGSATSTPSRFDVAGASTRKERVTSEEKSEINNTLEDLKSRQRTFKNAKELARIELLKTYEGKDKKAIEEEIEKTRLNRLEKMPKTSAQTDAQNRIYRALRDILKGPPFLEQYGITDGVGKALDRIEIPITKRERERRERSGE